MKAEHLRAELIAVLGAAQSPITTTDARIAVANRCGGQDGRPVVAEQVYRALVILQRRGVVRRVDEPASRHAQWELAMLLVHGDDEINTAATGSSRQSRKHLVPHHSREGVRR